MLLWLSERYCWGMEGMAGIGASRWVVASLLFEEDVASVALFIKDFTYLHRDEYFVLHLSLSLWAPHSIGEVCQD